MATTQDILIAARALNLDGGEGSGVRGHFTARENKAIESAVYSAKLISPSQSAAIDANRHQVAFNEARAMAGMHGEHAEQSRGTLTEMRQNLIASQQRDAARVGPVTIETIRAEHAQGFHLSTKDLAGLVGNHEKYLADHEKNARFYAKLADKLNALGDH